MNDNPLSASIVVGQINRSFVAVAQRQTVYLARFMIGLNLLIPMYLFIYARTVDEDYWRMFRGNHTVVEWFSCIQLLTIALVAFVNYEMVRISRQLKIPEKGSAEWIWLWLSLGFFIFGLDERFDLHEAMRDYIFRPAGIGVDLSYVIDGDIGLYLFYFIGLGFSVFLIKELRSQPKALLFCLLALMLTLPTVVIDAMPGSAMWGWQYRRFWDYTFEELGEVWAQLFFLLSFLIVLHGRFGRLASAQPSDNR